MGWTFSCLTPDDSDCPQSESLEFPDKQRADHQAKIHERLQKGHLTYVYNLED